MSESAECWLYGICPEESPEVAEEAVPEIYSFSNFTPRHMFLVLGLFLICSCRLLPVKIKYYLSACILGVGGLVIFVLYNMNLVFEKRFIAICSGILATSGWWIAISFFHSLFYQQILICFFLTIISSILIASYLNISSQTDDIIVTAWQISGSSLILFFSHDISYFVIVITILLFNNSPDLLQMVYKLFFFTRRPACAIAHSVQPVPTM